MADYFETIQQVNDVLQDVYPQVRKIKTVTQFQMLLGVLIDQWSADNNLTIAESIDMVQSLAEVHTTVNNDLGMMNKSPD